MSASVHGDLRDCQAFPRLKTTSCMTFWQAMSGVVRNWYSRAQGTSTFVSLDGRDVHHLGLSRWDVELKTARRFWRD
jgi:uncharacterized protein YjiS (DUF1127 family)